MKFVVNEILIYQLYNLLDSDLNLKPLLSLFKMNIIWLPLLWPIRLGIPGFIGDQGDDGRDGQPGSHGHTGWPGPRGPKGTDSRTCK